jgi:oxygen-independent coproporphyrinogen-3 oxidase
LPNQTVRDALSDLKIAISLGVQHISWYELTIENNTQFFNAPPTSLPDELTMDAIECEGINLLNNSGFARYEISAFSKFGFMCKHNLNYWMFGDYIGLGAGAHGKTTNPISQEITRYSKIADPSQYILCKNNFKKAYDDISVIQKNNIPFEFMLNAMRLVNGFSIDLFLYRTGLSINYIKKQLDQLTNQNMIVVKNGFVKPTSLGTKYLNDALLLFLRD